MELLRHIFAFNQDSPLLFTQFYFWAFFAVVYAAFALIMEVKSKHNANHRARLHLRNIFLMAVSWFFYYKTSGICLLILAFVTISDWLIAQRIAHTRGTNKARWWLVLSVVIDLSLLAYFKYAYFFTNVINNIFSTSFQVFDIFAYIGNGLQHSGRFIVDAIILPVGISFYLFQVISYTSDVYHGRVQPVTNLLDFGFYVSFFPQLVAGPIVRASEFIPQLYKPFHLSKRLFGLAVFWILNGLAKKIILSDYLAVNLIDRVFDNPLLFSGFENLFALFAYSLQVYADFSGYTDIAIGIAMLMGFYLPKNFDSPYKSRNPQEFWRRWHMSLSRWLKTYLYIPLGGNRTVLGFKLPKLIAGNMNSFIVMLLGGLWHGASWNFVIWGGLNGLGMIFAKCWAAGKEKLGITRWINRTTSIRRLDDGLCILLTFTFITFTRLFFRSSSNLDPATANQVAWETATNMLHQMAYAWDSAIILPFLWGYRYVVIMFVLGMTIHWLPTSFKRWYRLNFAMLPLWVMALIAVVVVFVIYQFVTADMQPFIYFQF
ncbi:MAG: MBOAT family protein [Paludibacteraceae bacterium]|nr:MBOAT family protein [Paludibacteraceae bacterium]